MAFSQEGLLGDFSGRIGNLVVYKLKGKTVIRSMPAVKRGPARGRLKQTQDGFSRVMTVVRGLKAFVKVGFHDFAGGDYVFQRALSENLKRYHSAGSPAGLDWLLLSAGERAGTQQLSLEVNGISATIKWGEPEPDKPWSENDTVMVLALNTSNLQSTQKSSTARRSQGKATLSLPPAKEGERIRVFVAFMHLEGRMTGLSPKNISDSQWVEP
jgi:hypothetical protein